MKLVSRGFGRRFDTAQLHQKTSVNPSTSEGYVARGRVYYVGLKTIPCTMGDLFFDGADWIRQGQ